MPKHNPIASDLERVLKSLEDNEAVSVLICTGLTQDAQQVVNYLQKQNAKHNYLGPNTGVVVADLTSKQVYDLAKQSYVHSIERNGTVKAT